MISILQIEPIVSYLLRIDGVGNSHVDPSSLYLGRLNTFSTNADQLRGVMDIRQRFPLHYAAERGSVSENEKSIFQFFHQKMN